MDQSAANDTSCINWNLDLTAMDLKIEPIQHPEPYPEAYDDFLVKRTKVINLPSGEILKEIYEKQNLSGSKDITKAMTGEGRWSDPFGSKNMMESFE